jgi:hypothetical protein
VTAQQQQAEYNAWASSREQMGQAIAESFLTQDEITKKSYEKRLTDLNIFLASAEGLEEKYGFVRVRLKMEEQAALGDLSAQGALERLKFDQMTWDMQVKTAAGSIAAITRGAATGNRTMFEINKLAALADITVSTAQGVMKAWGQGGIFGYGMAALIAAAGAFNFAKVASTHFGGGGGVAPSVSGAAGGATPVFPVAPVGAGSGGGSTVINVSIVTGHVIGPDGVQTLMDDIVLPALGGAINNGDVVIIGPNSRQAAILAEVDR